MSTYTHKIRCLHGALGATTAAAAGGDTTIAVDAAALADPVLAPGARVQFGGDPRFAYSVVSVGGGEIEVTPPLSDAVAAGAAIDRPPLDVVAETASADLLTACPEDPAHPVAANSAELVSAPEVVTTKLQQGSSGRSHPTLRSRVLELAAGAEGSVDFVWPYQVTVQRIEGIFEAANAGDALDLEAGPDSTAGYLTAPVGVGDTVINVSETVFTQGRAKPGFRLKLGTGPDPAAPTVGDDLGEIVATDAAAGTVTVETPAATALGAGPGHWALLTIASTVGMHVPAVAGTSVSTGSEFVLGVDVPANRPLRVTYHNNGAVASRAIIYMRYLI